VILGKVRVEGHAQQAGLGEVVDLQLGEGRRADVAVLDDEDRPAALGDEEAAVGGNRERDGALETGGEGGDFEVFGGGGLREGARCECDDKERCEEDGM
jgi:hypothetical protein